MRLKFGFVAPDGTFASNDARFASQIQHLFPRRYWVTSEDSTLRIFSKFQGMHLADKCLKRH